VTWSGAQTISGSSLTLTGSNGYITSQSSVTASAFFGNGAGLTGVTTNATGPAGGALSGSYPNPGLATSQSAAVTWSGAQTISGSSLTLTGSNGYITSQSSVTASAFFGNGAGLTNVAATPNVTGNSQFASANPLVLNSSSVTLQGNAFNSGSELLQLSGGQVPLANMPSNVAYENLGNNFNSSQTFSASGANTYSIGTSSGVSVGGGVYASFFVGNGADLTGVTATVLSTAPLMGNGTSGNPLGLNSSSVTLQGNSFNGNNELAQLNNGGNLVLSQGGVQAATGTFMGLTASSGTFTATGNNTYSITTDSGVLVENGVVSAPIFSVPVGAGNSFQGNGSQITNLNAGSLTNGQVPASVLANAILNQSTLQSGASFYVYAGTVTTNLTVAPGGSICFNGVCHQNWPSGISGIGQQYYVPLWSASSNLVNADITEQNSTVSVHAQLAVSSGIFSVGGSTFVVTGGNVGIGTAKPQSMLSLYGATAGTGVPLPDLNVYVNGDGTYPAFQSFNVLHGEVGLNFDAYYQPSGSFYSSNGTANFQLYDFNNDWIFGAAQNIAQGAVITWTDALAINGAGQVSVGTASPAAGSALTVAGTVSASSAAFTAGISAAGVSTFTASGNNTFSVTTSSGINIQAGSLCLGGVCNASWPSGGGSSAWTSGPVVELASVGASTNVVVQTTMTVLGNAFSVGGSTLVVSGGQVGIGTSNPGAGNALEVAGAGANTVAQFDASLASVNFKNGSDVDFSNSGNVNLAPTGGGSYVQVLGLYVSRPSAGVTDLSEGASGPVIARLK